MDYLLDSTFVEGDTAARGGRTGALRALQTILVVVVGSASMLVASGWWLVAGA